MIIIRLEERLTAALERSTTKLQEAHQVHLQQALLESNKLKQQQQQQQGCVQPILQPQQSLLASGNSNLIPPLQQGYVQSLQPMQIEGHACFSIATAVSANSISCFLLENAL